MGYIEGEGAVAGVRGEARSAPDVERDIRGIKHGKGREGGLA